MSTQVEAARAFSENRERFLVRRTHSIDEKRLFFFKELERFSSKRPVNLFGTRSKAPGNLFNKHLCCVLRSRTRGLAFTIYDIGDT